MRLVLAGDGLYIWGVRGKLAPFGERLAVGLCQRAPCPLACLCRLDLMHQLGARGIFARAIFRNAEPGEHRPAEAERHQGLRAERAEREEEQRGERIDVEDVARPEQHEHVQQPEGEQPQVAAIIEIGDRDRPVGRHRLARQHHHAGAEQEFEQAALGAGEEQVHRPPGVSIRRAPADQPDIGREGPDAGGHIGHVDVEDAEDRQPAQHVEHIDTGLALHRRQSGTARFHHALRPTREKPLL